jgi:hypothetical protein
MSAFKFGVGAFGRHMIENTSPPEKSNHELNGWRTKEP